MVADEGGELWDSLRERLSDEGSRDAAAVSGRQVTSSRAAVRPRSIRPDGLEGAGLHYDEAQLASTTGPVFNADDLPAGQILSPAQAIKGLYAAFNARDAECVASFLTDDCVYEDLLLGPATICRGKKAFMGALRFHPAFVTSGLFDRLPLAKELLPALTLEVDSVAEGVDTVGVEWHVQWGDAAFPLGRGLSQARVCTATGKIERVVDIAEAPWRVIGLIALPFISAVQALSQTVAQAPSGAAAKAKAVAGAAARRLLDEEDVSDPDGAASEPRPRSPADVLREYELMLGAVLADGRVDPAERALLAEYAETNSVSDAQHAVLLRGAGWSEAEYRDGLRAPKVDSV